MCQNFAQWNTKYACFTINNHASMHNARSDRVQGRLRAGSGVVGRQINACAAYLIARVFRRARRGV